MMYRIKDFATYESFRILINGVLQYQSKEDSQGVIVGHNDDEYASSKNFAIFKSDIIPYGLNSFEIAVISEKTTEDS